MEATGGRQMSCGLHPRLLATLALGGALLCAFVLAGCAHHAPATIHDRVAVISGHNTAHATTAGAVQTVLIEAAAITVDHGYRFFRLMTPVRPGANVTVRVYGNGEIDPHATDAYDAYAIAAGQMPKSGRQIVVQ
jgi:hypothetical protein